MNAQNAEQARSAEMKTMTTNNPHLAYDDSIAAKTSEIIAALTQQAVRRCKR